MKLDRWSADVDIVKDQADPQLPVYMVNPETNLKKVRTLHRDLLLPCGFLPIQDHGDSPKKVQHCDCVRSARSAPKKLCSSNGQKYDSDSDSMAVFSVQQDMHHSDSTDDEQESSEESSEQLLTGESSSEDRPAPHRSQRSRCSPTRLCYGSLGQPSVHVHNVYV